MSNPKPKLRSIYRIWEISKESGTPLDICLAFFCSINDSEKVEANSKIPISDLNIIHAYFAKKNSPIDDKYMDIIAWISKIIQLQFNSNFNNIHTQERTILSAKTENSSQKSNIKPDENPKQNDRKFEENVMENQKKDSKSFSINDHKKYIFRVITKEMSAREKRQVKEYNKYLAKYLNKKKAYQKILLEKEALFWRREARLKNEIKNTLGYKFDSDKLEYIIKNLKFILKSIT